VFKPFLTRGHGDRGLSVTLEVAAIPVFKPDPGRNSRVPFCHGKARAIRFTSPTHPWGADRHLTTTPPPGTPQLTVDRHSVRQIAPVRAPIGAPMPRNRCVQAASRAGARRFAPLCAPLSALNPCVQARSGPEAPTPLLGAIIRRSASAAHTHPTLGGPARSDHRVVPGDWWGAGQPATGHHERADSGAPVVPSTDGGAGSQVRPPTRAPASSASLNRQHKSPPTSSENVEQRARRAARSRPSSGDVVVPGLVRRRLAVGRRAPGAGCQGRRLGHQ
jgi:hypothetical protein